jgi:hypothetical protein
VFQFERGAGRSLEVEDEAWLTTLLSACRSALEKAENGEFPASADLIEDLRRFTREVERKLDRARVSGATTRD